MRHGAPSRTRLLLFLILLLGVFPVAAGFEVLLGTDRSGSFDHYTGKALCRMISRQAADIQCRAVPADAAGHAEADVHNLTNLQGGSLDIGIVDAATLAKAMKRRGQFRFFDIRYDNLRSLFSLHDIAFTLIGQRRAHIAGIEDLRGKTVNIGNLGSSQREIMNDLLAAKNWTNKTFRLVEQIPVTGAQDSLALCHGNVDAIVRVGIHPDASIDRLLRLCKTRLVKIPAADVERLTRSNPAYQSVTIAAHTYASEPEPITTFGVKDILVGSEELDEDTAYSIVSAIIGNLDRLRRTHPAFAGLTPAGMRTQGLAAPVHPGALRYYRERGWVD